jgi:hypothetical protein
MSPAEQIGSLCALTVVLLGAGVWIALQVKNGTPERREKRRRLHLNQTGRLGDALITEASDTLLYYTYSINGVEYSASQDISTLLDRLPAEPGRLVGLANLKYSTKHPGNSILLCEEWSGLRAGKNREAVRPAPDTVGATSDPPPPAPDPAREVSEPVRSTSEKTEP